MFDIKGGKELLRALELFPQKLQRNMLRSALGAGASVMRKAAQQKMKPATKSAADTIAENIVVKRPPIRNGDVRVGVGVRSKKYVRVVRTRDGKHKGIVHNPARVWHFIEGGTAERTQKSTGRKVGRTTAKHVFKSTLDEKSSAAIDAVAAKLRERINKGG